MGIWSDLATWVGPTPNRGGAMLEWRGVVLHIAEGTFEGTISWQKNDASNVSSHFIVAKDGRIAQMVDTDQVAWTQANGNGRWLSIENEGFTGSELTPSQFEANAQIIARGVKVYGYPVQLANSPEGRGLGWHGMGGTAWGNHPNCPGTPIVNQRQALLDRVAEILEGDRMVPDTPALAVTWDGSVAHYTWNTPDGHGLVVNEVIFRVSDHPFPQYPVTEDGNIVNFLGPWGTAYNVGNLEKGRTYYAQVYARNDNGWSAPGGATLVIGADTGGGGDLEFPLAVTLTGSFTGTIQPAA